MQLAKLWDNFRKDYWSLCSSSSINQCYYKSLRRLYFRVWITVSNVCNLMHSSRRTTKLGIPTSHILLEVETKCLSFSFSKRIFQLGFSTSESSFHFSSQVFREFCFSKFSTHKTFSASRRVFVQLRWVLNWFFSHVTEFLCWAQSNDKEGEDIFSKHFNFIKRNSKIFT